MSLNPLNMTMSDHQDSEHYMYNRTWDEIHNMLDRAEKKYNHHHSTYTKNAHKLSYKDRLYHIKQIKALQGVIKTLKWTLGDKDIEHPLE